ncbi:MAG: aromatic acid/H+ symport family MFS transporter, partial [Microbacteriaceae bacterium]|nr:aromatic acid/H+ symport family MFS transporter [Microbacteriaceae bacterium]
MDVTIVSHTFPSLIQEWGVDIGGGIALVVTFGYLAMGLGAIVGGRLADRFGRKIVIVVAAGIMSVGTALGATAADFGQFTAWRVFASLGIGAVMPLAITLLADLVPERRRGAMVAAGYAAV